MTSTGEIKLELNEDDLEDLKSIASKSNILNQRELKLIQKLTSLEDDSEYDRETSGKKTDKLEKEGEKKEKKEDENVEVEVGSNLGSGVGSGVVGNGVGKGVVGNGVEQVELDVEGSGSSVGSGVGIGVDENESNTPICRVCWEASSDKKNPLVNPCLCKGSMKWIHRDCLTKWIKMSNHDSCQECQYKYKFITKYSKEWHKWIDGFIFGHALTVSILFGLVYGFAALFRKLAKKILSRRKRHMINPLWNLPPTLSSRFLLEGVKGCFLLMLFVLPWMDKKGWINLNQIESELLNNSQSNSYFTEVYVLFYKAFYLCVRQIIKKIISVDLVIANVTEEH